MNVTQAGAIVNAVVKQALGQEALKAYQAGGLISLGDKVLSSSDVTETFLNTLVQRIAKTIISTRVYKNRHSDMLKGGVGEWGGIVQKIKITVGEFQEDPAYTLTDGQSVDQWTVHKPTAHQKFFFTEAPYLLEVTISKKNQLRTAFTSMEGMASFLDGLFVEIRNKLEIALENLGRTCIANFIAEVNGTEREVKLVTKYNADKGKTITAEQAMSDPDFLRYASKIIRLYSKKMVDMSAKYNDGTVDRFTPLDKQVFKVLADFEVNLENEVLYNAFHDNYVKLNAFSEYNFWQNQTDGEESNILINRASDGVETSVENVVAVLYDYDALGTFRIEEDVATTPINAKGLYYNVEHHNKQLWYNDLSENFVVFTLA